MKKQQGNVVLGLLAIALIAAAVVGYVWNIVKLFGITINGHEGEFVLRVIGVVTGVIGAIVGYF